MDEAALVRQACTGDPDAFDALVAPHLTRLYRLTYLITRNRESAADSVQEALLRAYRSLGNLRPGLPFYPWFARIAVNEAVKQAKVGRRFLHWLPLRGNPPAADVEPPEGLVQAREEQRELWAAIQALSPVHRTVIVLRYYDELSEAEMATVLAIRPGTVKSRLFHARAALAKVLQKQPQRGLLPAETMQGGAKV